MRQHFVLEPMQGGVLKDLELLGSDGKHAVFSDDRKIGSSHDGPVFQRDLSGGQGAAGVLPANDRAVLGLGQVR